MHKIFWLLVLSLTGSALYAHEPGKESRVLIAININSCSFCNKATNSVMDSNLLYKVVLLFNSEEVSAEQVDEFLSNNFEKKPRYAFNDELYRKATQHLKIFKSPRVIILDTSGAVIRTFPIDSIHFYDDLINAAVDGKPQRSEFANSRIRRIAGYTRENKIENHLFVTAMGNPSKMYDLNLNTKTLDSLCFTNNDKFIYKLLGMYGVKNIDVAQVRKLFREKRLPYEIVSFSMRPFHTRNKLFNVLYVEYLDPKNYSDTISTEILFFLISYDPVAKDLNVYTYKHYEKNWETGEIADDLRLDYITLLQVNDSLWMMGTEHINERINNEKTFVYFSNSSTDKELKYNGTRFSVQTDSMFTFDNEPMNNPMRMYFYELLPSFLYYNESPFYYNHKTRQTFDIRSVSEECEWIFDMEETDNVLSVLVKEQSNLVLYNIDKKTNHILKREVFGRDDSRGNVQIDGGDIVYLSKKGNVVTYAH